MAKILVVEDHPDLMEILTYQIQRMGLTVIAARHGEEGVAKAIQDKPDLILMDILMPKMDGLAATRILRSNPQTEAIPIVAATVLFRESDIKSCLEAGCNDYIVKPFTYHELQRKIRPYLSDSGSTLC